MRRIAIYGVLLSFVAGLSLAGTARAAAKTFVGSISDSMCGAKHMMPGQSDKDCTLACVKAGCQICACRRQRKGLSAQRSEEA